MKTPTLEDALQRLDTIPNKANRDLARAHLVYKSQTGKCKPQSLLAISDPLVALGKYLGAKPWSKATMDGVIDCIASHKFTRGAHLAKTPGTPKPLAASTRHQWWIHVKGFYKRRVPKAYGVLFAENAFPKGPSIEERGIKLALEADDVAKLIAGADSVRDRAIILTLLETGFRVSEAAALRFDHMEERDGGYWLRLPRDEPLLKTGPRTVAVGVYYAAQEFEAWLNAHPRRHEPKAPIFVNLSNRNQGTRMTGASISAVVARAAQRGRVECHAHMLRHTSATFKIAAGWPPEAIRLTHGWKPSSTMLSYYAHLAPHYEAMMLKARGLPDTTRSIRDIMGTRACQVCTTHNPVTARKCRKCGTPASDAAQVLEQRARSSNALDFLAPHAVLAFEDDLILAVARAKGFEVTA